MGLPESERGRLLEELYDFLEIDERRWLSPLELTARTGGGSLDDLAPVDRERRRILAALDTLDRAIEEDGIGPPRFLHLRGKRAVADSALLALAPEIELRRPVLGPVVAPLWFVAHLRPAAWDRVATLLGSDGLIARVELSRSAGEGRRDVEAWLRVWLERTRLAWVRHFLRTVINNAPVSDIEPVVDWTDQRAEAGPRWGPRDAASTTSQKGRRRWSLIGGGT